jgi:hypothetical protein
MQSRHSCGMIGTSSFKPLEVLAQHPRERSWIGRTRWLASVLVVLRTNWVPGIFAKPGGYVLSGW